MNECLEQIEEFAHSTNTMSYQSTSVSSAEVDIESSIKPQGNNKLNNITNINNNQHQSTHELRKETNCTKFQDSIGASKQQNENFCC